VRGAVEAAFAAFTPESLLLAWFYASPLLMIAASVAYGTGFMACQMRIDERVLHGNPHTADNDALNET